MTTPADIIAARLREWNDEWAGEPTHLGAIVIAALDAAGFDIVARQPDTKPIGIAVDTDKHPVGLTFAEATKRRTMDEVLDTCPTCDSRVPEYAQTGSECDPMAGGTPDAWHDRGQR